jgi:hypothetical protein
MSWRRPRHEHTWEVTSQRYTPPRSHDLELTGTAPTMLRLMQDVTYGYTVTGMRCTGCGDIKSRRDSGDIRP